MANKNYYVRKHFDKKNLHANVVNDKTKTVPTLSFTSDFSGVAKDLVALRSSINKDLKAVSDDILAIKKDQKTGALLKGSLTKQYNAFEDARKDFLRSLKQLYNAAISEYNTTLQRMYDSLNTSDVTKAGAAQKAVAENLADD